MAGSSCHRRHCRRLENNIRNTFDIDINCRGFSFFKSSLGGGLRNTLTFLAFTAISTLLSFLNLLMRRKWWRCLATVNIVNGWRIFFETPLTLISIVGVFCFSKVPESPLGGGLRKAPCLFGHFDSPLFFKSPNETKMAGSSCWRRYYPYLEKIIPNAICIDINCRGFSFFIFPDLAPKCRFYLKCVIWTPNHPKKKKSADICFSFLGHAPRPKAFPGA